MRGRVAAVAVAFVVASPFVACGGNDFSSDPADAGDGDAGSLEAQAADAPNSADGAVIGADASPIGSTIGCADGTREYLVDASKLKSIAGCSGGWTVPGLGSPATCGKHGASAKTNNGCSAEDLCALGWHVCANVAEAARNGISACPAFTATDIDAGEYFASAQRSGGGASCVEPQPDSGADDLFGCGTFGAGTGACEAFTLYLANNQASLGEWSLGSDGSNERINVTKGPDNGGVLCCSN